MDLSTLYLPLADWVSSAVDWMSIAWMPFFDGISLIFNTMVTGLETALQSPPDIVLIIIFAAIAWVARSWKFGVFSLLAFALVAVMGMWDQAMSTLSLVLVSAFVALILGIPAGIIAAYNDTFSAIIKPILDFMQTMPAMVYLIPSVIFFGLGFVPGVVSTILFAMPPATRMTELGIRGVNPETVEAGRAFGASTGKILRRIQLPLALPSIMAGVNQVIMLSLSMVVIAGMVGARGLGAVVYGAVTRLDVGLGFEGGLAVVIIAVFLDRVTGALGDRATKRIG